MAVLVIIPVAAVLDPAVLGGGGTAPLGLPGQRTAVAVACHAVPGAVVGGVIDRGDDIGEGGVVNTGGVAGEADGLEGGAAHESARADEIHSVLDRHGREPGVAREGVGADLGHTRLNREGEGVAPRRHGHRAAAENTHVVARDFVVHAAAAGAGGGRLVGHGVVHGFGGLGSLLGGNFYRRFFGGLRRLFRRCLSGFPDDLLEDLFDVLLHGERLFDSLLGRDLVDEEDLLKLAVRRLLREGCHGDEGQQHAEDQRDADQFLFHGSFSFVCAQYSLSGK